jgi:phage terminase small subunit
MAATLTVKQDRFAREYVKDGNGTRAAKKAGYSANTAHVIASENLRKPKVEAAIRKHRQRVAERLDVSREKLINDAAHDAESASLQGDWSGATSARTFIAKAQGYMVERSINVNVDASAAHLEALRALVDRRSQPSHALQGGDDASRIMDVMENADDD